MTIKRLLFVYGPSLSALGSFLLYLLFPSLTVLVYFSLIFSLVPYYINIWRGLVRRQLDLSLPSIITIFLLIYLGKANVALLFIGIIVLGDLFKNIIIERVKASVTAIAAKLPKTATILVNNEEKIVGIDQVGVGDILSVKSGERIATDSTLLSKEALLDESVVTGESKPVTKFKGERILAGSINSGNYYNAVATSTASNSTLLQIQHLVTEAQFSKAPLAQIVSKYAWLTIIFALLGMAIVFVVTGNIFETLSFWIAVVPVIFAIITPVATTIGITILAKSGILVKNSPALENLTKVTTFLFDKTGTITEGKPEVAELVGFGETKENVLALAASLEFYSNHPLAAPILKEAQKEGVKRNDIESVNTVPGKGVYAKYNGKDIFLGNKSLVTDRAITVPIKVNELVDHWEGVGATTVFVGEDSKILGTIFLLDKIRPETRPLFNELSVLKYETIILTGDKKEVADQIAKDLPNTKIIAEVSPEGKVAEIDNQTKSGKMVAMIGDGINDAPALAKANVGIAMGGGGIDMTLNAADIVLLNNRIDTIPKMIEVSSKTFRIIKQDVVLATFIHLITVIFVLTGYFNLIQTTLAHELSSILVLTNTLRLFRIKSRIE